MAEELSRLQVRILEALVDLTPPWTLTGGAALVGFHLHHRTTRDLDLFVYGQSTLEGYAAQVIAALGTAGMQATSQQSGSVMHRLLVTSGDETTVVDLVADPVANIESPVKLAIGEFTVRVDTAHEILVNKLCTLVQRSELRDLFDVQELLNAGGDLQRALHDAPQKDGGFSPLTLSWLLKQLPVRGAGEAEGWSEKQIQLLEQFRSSLVATLTDLTRPPGE